METSTQRDIVPLIPVIIVLTLVNLLMLAYVIAVDTQFQGSSSYGIIAGNWLEGRYSLDGKNLTFSRPPLYPALLAFAQLLGQGNWSFTARVLQGLMSILCGVLIFLIAQRISHSNGIAYLATAFYVAHLALLFEHYAQRETLLFELMLLAYVYILATSEQLSLKRVVFIALLCAGLHLTRPTGVALLIIALLMILISERGSRRIVSYPLVLLFSFILFIAPWQYYNYRAFSRITLSSSNTTGLNLYKGAAPVVQAIYPQMDVDKAEFYIESQLQRAGIDSRKSEYEANDFLRAEARKHITRNPGAYLRGMLLKLAAFYSPVPTPIGSGEVVLEGNELVVNDFSFRLGFTGFSHFIVTIFVIPLGFLGLLFGGGAGRRDLKFRIVVILIFVSVTTLHLLSFAETRFRLPLDGLLCIAAALFLGRPGYFRFNGIQN